MTEQEKKIIVKDLIDIIRTFEKGDTGSTAELMVEAGYDLSKYDTLELIKIQYKFEKEAKKENIILDYSEHDGKLVGLPFNVRFTIK